MAQRSIISSKGQIVIPADLRKRYGLKAGTGVVFHEDRGRLVLEPSNHAAIYALQAFEKLGKTLKWLRLPQFGQ